MAQSRLLLHGLLTLALAAPAPTSALGLEEDEKKEAQATGLPDLPRPPWSVGSSALDRAAERALADGLRYLAGQLADSEDGSFPLSEGRRSDYAPVGVTSLGALAFMSAGNAPGRGPYGAEVDRILDYLLRLVNLDAGSEKHGYIEAQGDKWSRTHGHGYATLVLAEAYGMDRSPRLRPALIAAVRRIEESQGSEGGWYYEPRRTAQHEGSVTICYVQALRAARNAGIAVDVKVIQRADDYVRRLQKPDGTFRYQLDREDSSIALTAAAVSTLNMTGRYDDPIIRSSVDAIWSGLGLASEGGLDVDFPHYQRFYLAQAFWQLSDPTHFQRWFDDERGTLVRTQSKDGSWRDPRYGNAYATAVACLVLTMPEGVLPIFQR